MHPGHDDPMADLGLGGDTGATRLPGQHPSVPPETWRRRFKRWVLARRWARYLPTFRYHRDALSERIDRIDAERRQDRQLLFTALGQLSDRLEFVEDTLVVVRDRPESVALGVLIEEVVAIRLEALDYYRERRRWREFLEDFAQSATHAATSAMAAVADLDDNGRRS